MIYKVASGQISPSSFPTSYHCILISLPSLSLIPLHTFLELQDSAVSGFLRSTLLFDSTFLLLSTIFLLPVRQHTYPLFAANRIKINNQTVDFNKLPVLSGTEKYQLWPQRLTSFLRMRGLWRYVSGEQDAPFAPEISSWNKSWFELSMPKKSKERLNKLSRNWKEADDKAHGIICSTLSPAIETEVINLSSSSLVWENLRSKYAHASMSIPAVVGLRKALGIYYDDCNSIQENASMMSAALDEFDRSLSEGEKLPESARIHSLLCNLGESWDDFASSYLGIRYDQKLETFHSVIQVLIQAEPEAEAEQPVENLVMQNSFSHVEFDKAIKSTNKEEIGFGSSMDYIFDGFGFTFWEWKRLN